MVLFICTALPIYILCKENALIFYQHLKLESIYLPSVLILQSLSKYLQYNTVYVYIVYIL